MVAYLASGKSRHTSQVFSKQGGKATRPILENILKNSENVCKYKAADGCSLFFTFDNIQTLLKSHRIGGEHQKKVLAIVVTSTLCLQPDGDKKSQIQCKVENCPENWLFTYKFHQETKLFDKSINVAFLKKCVGLTKEEEEIFEKVFEKDIEKALEFVKKDMFKNLQDPVDIQAKVNTAKRRKLCANGHINDNVRSNRKVCDREACKAELDMVRGTANVSVPKEVGKDVTDKVAQKAELYLNVPNILPEEIPKECAVGASDVNPNKPDRIARIFDELLESAGMKNKFSVKIILNGTSVKKESIVDESFRKHIVVTADGLPYKIMISLIANTHTCAMCGKRLVHIADMTDHMKDTHHNEFYQTYGAILPNIGYFHYALTMLRSLVKLEWNIDYRELCKSIHFETEKALFMQEKVTDFRKSLDTYRTVREAKLRELVTPYVKYSLENNLQIDVKSYFLWKKFFVQSQTYNTVFDIEKTYGTSFLLFHAALRANNFPLVKIAKKVFSPLFHINRHPNYSVMDIHTDYVEHTLSEKAPELNEYLVTRRCSNFTGKPYSSEPHDERHEEFNKRGLNMQNVKSVEDFKQSFQLVDHYNEMKETIFDDYNIKMHGGNVITIPEYEDNIFKMRVNMRQQSYLNKPKLKTGLFSLDEKELNPKLTDVVDIAKMQRQDNVLNVIRHNDFDYGYKNNSKINIMKEELDDKLGTDFETQLRILIASEENAELRENLKEYCSASKNTPDFNEEKLVDDILKKNFSFL